jgi:hypothetical protein
LATRQELSSKASFRDDFRIDYPPAAVRPLQVEAKCTIDL